MHQLSKSVCDYAIPVFRLVTSAWATLINELSSGWANLFWNWFFG